MFNITDKGKSDEKLMQELKEGNLSAFEVIYRKYAPRLINFALRFVANKEAAEDMAQEILLKVYDHRFQYQPTAKFSTWLYRVAANHCLNEVRKPEYEAQNVSMEQLAERGIEPREAESEHPDEIHLRREKAQRAAQAFRNLPANQKTALSLLIDEGLSYAQIAEALGVSVAAVKALISRARENLRRSLFTSDEGEVDEV